MKNISSNLFLCLLCCIYMPILAQQNDLEAMLEEEMGEAVDYTYGTFLSTFVLSNHSVEMLTKNGLNFRFSHKFDYLSKGAENAFGFDHSSVYYGLEYAPVNWVNIGIGRTTLFKSINGHLKIRILRQSAGKKKVPLSLVLFTEADYNTEKKTNPEVDSDMPGRFEYTTQLLIARKFMDKFSVQLMPTLLHRNLVESKEDVNTLGALGFGATYKLIKRFRLNAEYTIVQDHNTSEAEYHSPVSLGICYQTSRHTFELFATNSQGITANNNIGRTTSNFWEGDIAIGFNVSIIFTAK